MMLWTPLHPRATPDMLGFLPGFLSEEDPRPAREQLDANYAQGGGWRPFSGFTLLPDGGLKYPGDPPMRPIWETWLRDERVRLYEHDWVMIQQSDGSFEIARMD